MIEILEEHQAEAKADDPARGYDISGRAILLRKSTFCGMADSATRGLKEQVMLNAGFTLILMDT